MQKSIKISEKGGKILIIMQKCINFGVFGKNGSILMQKCIKIGPFLHKTRYHSASSSSDPTRSYRAILRPSPRTTGFNLPLSHNRFRIFTAVR